MNRSLEMLFILFTAITVLQTVTGITVLQTVTGITVLQTVTGILHDLGF